MLGSCHGGGKALFAFLFSLFFGANQRNENGGRSGENTCLK